MAVGDNSPLIVESLLSAVPGSFSSEAPTGVKMGKGGRQIVRDCIRGEIGCGIGRATCGLGCTIREGCGMTPGRGYFITPPGSGGGAGGKCGMVPADNGGGRRKASAAFGRGYGVVATSLVWGSGIAAGRGAGGGYGVATTSLGWGSGIAAGGEAGGS
jgi:hypothetical protein